MNTLTKQPKDMGSPGSLANEESANQEDNSVSQKDYERVQRKRKLDFKKHVHLASIGALWAFFFFYIIMAIVWLIDLIMPSWINLLPENAATLQSVLFGTIIGGIVGQFSRKVLED